MSGRITCNMASLQQIAQDFGILSSSTGASDDIHVMALSTCGLYRPCWFFRRIREHPSPREFEDSRFEGRAQTSDENRIDASDTDYIGKPDSVDRVFPMISAVGKWGELPISADPSDGNCVELGTITAIDDIGYTGISDIAAIWGIRPDQSPSQPK